QILPPARSATWSGDEAPPYALPVAPFAGRSDAWGHPKRDFEFTACDRRGHGVGRGAVLDDGTTDGPYQLKTSLFGRQLNGAVTLWVRRNVQVNPNGSFADYSTDDDELVLTAEGVAPFSSLASATLATRAAEATVEVTLRRTPVLTPQDCSARLGQAGSGGAGAGFGACDALEASGIAI